MMYWRPHQFPSRRQIFTWRYHSDEVAQCRLMPQLAVTDYPQHVIELRPNTVLNCRN